MAKNPINVTNDTSDAENKPRKDFYTDLEADAKYKPEQSIQERINLLYDRFYEMRDNPHRVDAEQDWLKGDQAYRSYVEPLAEDDDRTNLNLDPSFGIIETINQETFERNARPFYEPFEDSDKPLIHLINDVARSSYEIGRFDVQWAFAKKERDIRGTAVLMEMYRYETRWVKDMTVKKDPKTGEFIESYTEQEIVDWDDVYAMWRPLDEFYFDTSALHIDLAKDMVWRETLHINEFRRKYATRRGFFDVDKVTVAGKNLADDSAYQRPKDNEGTDDVEVLHYYNRATDEYVVMTNGVLNRDGPIPYPHKELPVSVYYCYKDPQRFYGMGIPKIIEQEAAEITSNRNLRLDSIKRAVQKMFFVDDTADIDEYDLMPRPHGLIPVNTNGRPITQVVTPLEYSDVKQSTYQDEELLYEGVRRKVGIDDRVQGVQAGGTATEAAILKEAAQKRINAQSLFNERDGLTRLGRLRWANIIFFYSLPRIKRITQKGDQRSMQTETRKIKVRGRAYSFDKDGNLQMQDKDGFSTLALTKKVMKYLNHNVDTTIDVEAGNTLSKPIRQAKLTEMMDRLLLPQNAPYVDKPKALQSYIEGNDEKPENYLKATAIDTPDPHELAESEFEVMLAGIPIPPTPHADTDHIVHEIVLTRGRRFEEAPDQIKDLIETHIAQEDANLRANLNGSQTSVGRGGDVEGTSAGLDRPNDNPVDLAPNNINAEA